MMFGRVAVQGTKDAGGNEREGSSIRVVRVGSLVRARGKDQADGPDIPSEVYS